MKLAIVIIGDEILLGRVTDTNSGLVARTFAADGWTVAGVRTVGDSREAIRDAVEASLAEADLVITTGGLGPTRDDITRGVMMEIFGGTLVHDAEVEANIKEIFAGRSLPLNALTLGQAMVPDTCHVIQNRYGTAPVMCFSRDGKMLVTMPGVPFETRGMLPTVAAAVRERFGAGGAIMHREFTVVGITESALAERLAPFEDTLPANVKLAYLPDPGEIVLRLDCDYGSKADTAHFESLCSRLKEAVGEYLAGEGKLTPAELVVAALRRHGYTMATAESCTGGNIAHLITTLAGCSDVYKGGVVSYANEVKTDVLGVPDEQIAAHGAVSEPVVRAMAEGTARICGADCAVATSGIAGPGGGTAEKPVGTVWIAGHTPAGTRAECFRFRGDRQAVIDRASAQALAMLTAMLG